MRRAWGFLVVAILLAGCSRGESRTGDGTDDSGNPGSGKGEGTDGNGTGNSTLYQLQDPDLLGIGQPGFREISFSSNRSFRFNTYAFAGPAGSNAVRWLVAYPYGFWQNQTKGCTLLPEHVQVSDLIPFSRDTFLNHVFPAGNWSILVWSDKLSNLTLNVFNATKVGKFHWMNGTEISVDGRSLDATISVAETNTNYHANFTKSFPVANRSLVLGRFSSGGTYVDPHEIYSKFEGPSGYLCNEQRVGQGGAGASGGRTAITRLEALLGEAGDYRFTGHFDAGRGFGVQNLAHADVISWRPPGGNETMPVLPG